MVLWLPKFWRMDGRRQTGSSLSRVLKCMERLDGPHGMYGTVFGEIWCLVLPESDLGCSSDRLPFCVVMWVRCVVLCWCCAVLCCVVLVLCCVWLCVALFCLALRYKCQAQPCPCACRQRRLGSKRTLPKPIVGDEQDVASEVIHRPVEGDT